MIGTRLGDKQEINIGIRTWGMMDYRASDDGFVLFFHCGKVHIIFTILIILKRMVQWY